VHAKEIHAWVPVKKLLKCNGGSSMGHLGQMPPLPPSLPFVEKSYHLLRKITEPSL